MKQQNSSKHLVYLIISSILQKQKLIVIRFSQNIDKTATLFNAQYAPFEIIVPHILRHSSLMTLTPLINLQNLIT